MRSVVQRVVAPLHPRLRIDIGVDELVRGLALGLLASARAEPDDPGAPLLCLSVRSAWDLYLSARAYPEGSEVLVSALTIPGMIEVVEAHGLVPVPVDIDEATLAPTLDSLRSATTDRTRAVLIAHLFGGRVDLDDSGIGGYCQARGLHLVEDAAQAFSGRFDRHPLASAALYSFGTLKTRTALGGAVCLVAEPDLRARMERRLAAQAAQPKLQYARKLSRFLALAAFRGPTRYGLLTSAIRQAGLDYDVILREATRGFSATTSDARFSQLRQRPCAALAEMVRRRVRAEGAPAVEARTRVGERLKSLLREELVVGRAQRSSHWLFAVAVREPFRLVQTLRENGFDAARGTTSLFAVPPPPGRPAPRAAQRLMERVVFLPAYPEVGEAELERLASLVNRAAA